MNPFSLLCQAHYAKLIDGYVWGRGPWDMEGGIAMVITAMLRFRAEGIPPPEDYVQACFHRSSVSRQFCVPPTHAGSRGRIGHRKHGRAWYALRPSSAQHRQSDNVAGGEQINGIPGGISLGVYGRLRPGYKPSSDLFDDLKHIIGHDIDLALVQHDSCPPTTNMGLFNTLTEVLREANH